MTNGNASTRKRSRFSVDTGDDSAVDIHVMGVANGEDVGHDGAMQDTSRITKMNIDAENMSIVVVDEQSQQSSISGNDVLSYNDVPQCCSYSTSLTKEIETESMQDIYEVDEAYSVDGWDYPYEMEWDTHEHHGFGTNDDGDCDGNDVSDRPGFVLEESSVEIYTASLTRALAESGLGHANPLVSVNMVADYNMQLAVKTQIGNNNSGEQLEFPTSCGNTDPRKKEVLLKR